MSRVREIFPTLENLVWRKHIQLTSPHEVKECVSKLEAADGTQVSSIKVATYISPYAPKDDIVRFAIKNWYGSVKVWVVGTLSIDQEEGVSIQVDIGISQIDALLYVGFPFLTFPLLYNNTYSFLHNVIVIGIGFSILFSIVIFAIILGKNQLQKVITEILL